MTRPLPSAVASRDTRRAEASRAQHHMASLESLVACPRCRSELSLQAEGFLCGPCDASFGPVGSVPCLLPDPTMARRRWRNHLALIRGEGEATIRAFEAELRRPGLLSATRSRLTKQIDLTRLVMDELEGHLVPAVGHPLDPEGPIPRFSPLETVHLLHRDWAWSESQENDRALECVRQALVAPLKKTLVIGAGACRLAYDLHITAGASHTVALDIDPLVLLVADRVMDGERVQLTEPRANAADLSQMSALRQLQAARGPMANITPLLADGLMPPVRADAFDTVITPWFTDLVPDLRLFIGEVIRALAPGGRWIHFGPLLYPIHRPGADRFSQDELFELLDLAGFTRETCIQASLNYSFSPLTGRGRIEPCFAMSAQLRRIPDRSTDTLSNEPRWLVLPYLPVPDFEGRASMRHPRSGFRAVLELVDGSRSAAAIADALAARAGARPDGLLDAVRHTLREVHPACREKKIAAIS